MTSSSLSSGETTEQTTAEATRPARPRRVAGQVRITRSDEVYQRLRADILELNLRPGDLLDEDQLASTYGVSRTPVREALRRLGSDGLVTLRPHRGAYVSEISIQEVREIEQLCELVEPVAARMACGRMSPAVISELRRELERFDIETPQREDFISYMQMDIRFHRAILDAAGNTIMRDMITHLYQRMNAVRLIANMHRFNHSINEHRRILDAIESGDGDAACAAARFHIEQRTYRQRFTRALQDGGAL